MKVPPERRKSRAKKLSFPERREAGRQPLQLRLTPEEDALIEVLAARMGGETKTYVIEEALRRFLPLIHDASTYMQRAIPAPSIRRHYKIRADISDALRAVCVKHHWELNTVTRHALLELGNHLQRQD